MTKKRPLSSGTNTQQHRHKKPVTSIIAAFADMDGQRQFGNDAETLDFFGLSEYNSVRQLEFMEVFFMGFGIGSGSTSERLSFFDDRSKLQHKQEFPTNGNNQCKEYPRKAKKQTKAKVMCFLKKIGLK